MNDAHPDNPIEGPSTVPGKARRSRWLMWAILALVLGAYLFASRPRASAVAWEHDFDAGLARASAGRKLVLVDFYGQWCPPCRVMDREVFSRRDVADALAEWVPIKIEGNRNAKLAAQFGVEALPTFVVLSPEGEAIAGSTGAITAEGFMDWLAEAEQRWNELQLPG